MKTTSLMNVAAAIVLISMPLAFEHWGGRGTSGESGRPDSAGNAPTTEAKWATGHASGTQTRTPVIGDSGRRPSPMDAVECGTPPPEDPDTNE